MFKSNNGKEFLSKNEKGFMELIRSCSISVGECIAWNGGVLALYDAYISPPTRENLNNVIVSLVKKKFIRFRDGKVWLLEAGAKYLRGEY